MKKGTVIAIVIAISLIVTGGFVWVLGVCMGGSFDGGPYTEHNAAYACPAKEISIDVTVSDIYVYRCASDKVELSWYESEKSKYTIEADDDRISIKHKYNKKWYDYIGINININFNRDYDRLSIGIPENYMGDMIINTTVGDVEIKRVEFAGRLDIDATVGDVELDTVRAESIDIDTTTGDVDVERISAVKSIIIDTTVGEVEGSIDGSPSDYAISSSTNLGDNSLKGITGTGSVILSVSTTVGDIDLTFQK